MRIILASSSKNRNEFFQKLGLLYECIPPNVDENTYKLQYTADPRELAIKLAEAKGEAVAATQSNAIIIAADTINIRGGQIHGKPKSYEEAFAMIKKVSNTTETVYTGVCMINTATQEKHLDVAELIVHFNPMRDEDIHNHLKELEATKGFGHTSTGFDPTSIFALKHHKRIEGSSSLLIYGIPFELVLPKLREWNINI